MSDPKLVLDDVNIYYGDFHAVQNVNLTIPAQAVTAFIGPSGCGKSTVLRTLNRMHEVIPGARVAGKIVLDGQDIYAHNVDPVAVRMNVGMVFQKANPFPTMSIEENVVAGLKLAGVKDKKRLREVAEKSLRGANLWEEVKDRLDKPGGGLSGGQQQRVAIARALMMEPQVLLFDEPTAALDPEITAQIVSIIRELAETNITQVIVTHEVEVARKTASRVVYMENGHIVEQGDASCFTEPQTEAFKNYLSH